MNDGEIIIVLVYVDDLLLVVSSLAEIYKIKDALHKRFEMKDLGEAKVILGREIRRDKALGTLELSQGKYAAQVLEKFGMAECNPIGTPLEVGLQLVKANESDDALPYREAVGSLMYLMVGTRPDISPLWSECTSCRRLVTRPSPAPGIRVIAAFPYKHGSQTSLTAMEEHLSPSISLFLIIRSTPATLTCPRRSCQS